MKKISLSALALVLLLVGLLCVPAVSANEIFNKTYTESEVTNLVTTGTMQTHSVSNINALIIANEYFGAKLNSLIWQMPLAQVSNAEQCPISDYWDVTITGKYSGITYYTGEMGYFKYKTGSNDYFQVMLFIDDGILEGFDTADIKSDCAILQISPAPSETIIPSFGGFQTLAGTHELRLVASPNPIAGAYAAPSGNFLVMYKQDNHAAIEYAWANNLVVLEEDQYSDIYLNRNVGAISASTIIIQTSDLSTSNTSTDNNYSQRVVKYLYPFSTSIYNPASGSWFNETFHDVEVEPTPPPIDTPVTVYIRNSQTGALLADSHIVISASVDNEFHEIINKTLPSGTYTGDLQPTGGGMPNPDFYRLIPTAEGYNSIMPYIDFEVGGGATIYAYLDPVGGAPEDENNTFIDFFVRDMSANPISGATVNFGGYTLITNSAGYTIFEVDKNKTYTWTVSKSGYGSLTGNVVIGDDPRYTINTVLAPSVTPTTPTAIPTSTPISPTPTMTAPTGELVSNWLEWFAAHFGMILGGGAEIGKIFMWLCFSVPVGVYVGKEAKAGAAGFLAGAGVVTLFFVLIGWVPIWLLVLIALIIGLLYSKVFNNSDNGGGR